MLKAWKPPLSVRIGAGPAHEPVQSAQRVDCLYSRPQVQVVGVAQHDLSADPGNLLWRQALDGGLGSHWHEQGRRRGPVRRVNFAGAGRPVGVLQLKCKGGGGHVCYSVS